jgi:hypothetical protein
MKFKAGERVAWTHRLPSIYGKGVVLKKSAVMALDQQTALATVVGLENDKGTLIRIQLDEDHEPYTGKAHKQLNDQGECVVTSDELIRVEDDDEPETADAPEPAKKKKGA